MKRRNAIALGILAAIVLALAAWALRPRPMLVEAATVARGVFEQLVADDGRTRTRDRYTVSAPLAGRCGASCCARILRCIGRGNLSRWVVNLLEGARSG